MLRKVVLLMEEYQEEAFSQLAQGMKLVKCRKCGCMRELLEGLNSSLPEELSECELPLAFARGFLPHDRKFLLPGKGLPHNHRMSGDME